MVNNYGITVAPMEAGGYLCTSIVDGELIAVQVDSFTDAMELHPADLMNRSHT